MDTLLAIIRTYLKLYISLTSTSNIMYLYMYIVIRVAGRQGEDVANVASWNAR